MLPLEEVVRPRTVTHLSAGRNIIAKPKIKAHILDKMVQETVGNYRRNDGETVSTELINTKRVRAPAHPPRIIMLHYGSQWEVV
jgi:hypothetical protein